jgi:hypothetical protein
MVGVKVTPSVLEFQDCVNLYHAAISILEKHSGRTDNSVAVESR